MFEKVNPSHPDKVADRIAGALVDLAYEKAENPKIAVEVLIGHGECHIIAETSEHFTSDEVSGIVTRILGEAVLTSYTEVPQDKHLAANQSKEIRCGDNGIFKGVPVTEEQRILAMKAREIYAEYPTDGKYIYDRKQGRVVICQSNAKAKDLEKKFPGAEINPIGDWTGGIGVDTGATNRKLGSDMGDSVTGGGLHGKDLSKADVSVNICVWLEAQKTGRTIEACCAIGDTEINGVPYALIVETARDYIKSRGGFEKFAEWGLI